MMTETEELRALLDERGVQYEADDGRAVRTTTWANANGKESSFAEYDTGETRFITDCLKFTAGQAVDATLGRGECEMETDYDELEEGITGAPEDTWAHRCGACGRSFRYTRGIKPRYCPNCGRRVREVR